ncbi:MAG: hypothetical protein R3B95_19200 [Nitrospirales bacterium]|nr:hypothetical protein [Nitrospirales bacterium]
MNQSQYARRIGVSRSMVNRLVKRGIIPIDENGQVDVTEADQAYAHALHPGYDHNRRAKLPLEGHEGVPDPDVPVSFVSVGGGAEDPVLDHGGAPKGISQFKIHATEQKRWQALIARLDYEERAGKLVDVREIETQAFRVYRDVRDALMNIPGRVAAELAAELGLDSNRGQDTVFDILTREITEVLEGLAHGVQESSD